MEYTPITITILFEPSVYTFSFCVENTIGIWLGTLDLIAERSFWPCPIPPPEVPLEFPAEVEVEAEDDPELFILLKFFEALAATGPEESEIVWPDWILLKN